MTLLMNKNPSHKSDSHTHTHTLVGGSFVAPLAILYNQSLCFPLSVQIFSIRYHAHPHFFTSRARQRKQRYQPRSSYLVAVIIIGGGGGGAIAHPSSRHPTKSTHFDIYSIYLCAPFLPFSNTERSIGVVVVVELFDRFRHRPPATTPQLAAAAALVIYPNRMAGRRRRRLRRTLSPSSGTCWLLLSHK